MMVLTLASADLTVLFIQINIAIQFSTQLKMQIKVYVDHTAGTENMKEKDTRIVMMATDSIMMAALANAKLKLDSPALMLRESSLCVLLFVEMEKLIKMKSVIILPQVGTLKLVETNVLKRCLIQ